MRPAVGCSPDTRTCCWGSPPPVARHAERRSGCCEPIERSMGFGARAGPARDDCQVRAPVARGHRAPVGSGGRGRETGLHRRRGVPPEQSRPGPELSGEPRAAIGTLRSAIEKASAAGDFRAAAVARVRLGRVLRATGDRESARSMVDAAMDWYDGFGGGEGALLAESTLAALAAEDGVDGVAGVDGVDVARQRLSVALDHARQAQDHEAEVLTLDALARSHASAGELGRALELLAQADDIMPAAAHLVFDSDRIDARQARDFIENAHGLDAASTPA